MDSSAYNERGSLHVLAQGAAAAAAAASAPAAATPDSSSSSSAATTRHAATSTRFIGSASGVFFSKTVFAAFAPSIGGTFDQVFLTREDDGDDENDDSGEADDNATNASPRFWLGASSPAAYSNGSLNARVAPWADPLLLSLDMLPPDERQAIELARIYFRSWHLLFPFLDGRSFLSQLRALYAARTPNHDPDASLVPIHCIRSKSYLFSLVARCVLTLAHTALPQQWQHHHHHDHHPRHSISSTVPGHASGAILQGRATALKYLPHILSAATSDSVGAVQAALALELYFISTFRLRAAHQVGGIAVRLSYDAGLHRCPARFSAFAESPSLVALRKRVWHSVVSLDRFTSQQLGLPLGVQEDDYDVCELAAPELHQVDGLLRANGTAAQAGSAAAGGSRDPLVGLAAPKDGDAHNRGAADRRRSSNGVGNVPSKDRRTSALRDPVDCDRPEDCGRARTRVPTASPQQDCASRLEASPNAKESYARSFATLQLLNARAAEIFNKNIAKRRPNPEAVLQLRSDLDRWWNEIDLASTDGSTDQGVRPLGGSLEQQARFFRVCHHAALLNLERPVLSQLPGTPTFSAAMQSAIRCSRQVTSNLHHEVHMLGRDASSQSVSLCLLWPGFVQATFQAALVFAYAAKTGEYPPHLAAQGMEKAIAVLSQLGYRWEAVKPQASAVAVLLKEVQSGDFAQPSSTKRGRRSGAHGGGRGDKEANKTAASESEPQPAASKRRRKMDGEDARPHDEQGKGTVDGGHTTYEPLQPSPAGLLARDGYWDGAESAPQCDTSCADYAPVNAQLHPPYPWTGPTLPHYTAVPDQPLQPPDGSYLSQETQQYRSQDLYGSFSRMSDGDVGMENDDDFRTLQAWDELLKYVEGFLPPLHQ